MKRTTIKLGCWISLGLRASKNLFKHICINYTNETLQQKFNKFFFSKKQMAYEHEGILLKYISFPGNHEFLDLIDQKNVDILALLDEQRIVPGSKDERLCL